MFVFVRTCVCVSVFLVHFCLFFSVCFLSFILPCLFSTEGEKEGMQLDKQGVGKFWEETREGNCHQNIAYEKILSI